MNNGNIKKSLANIFSNKTQKLSFVGASGYKLFITPKDLGLVTKLYDWADDDEYEIPLLEIFNSPIEISINDVDYYAYIALNGTNNTIAESILSFEY